ncbi:MAG: hypothetical protein KJO98_08240 [Rhodothermia bacterium]|nr:hypothetical protein [Rhodothermia bacterium]
MSEQENQRSEQYKRVRDNFEELPFEEKASFLLEAVFATVTRGIERAGKVVSEELETVFKQAQEAAERAARKASDESDGESSEKASENGAADPEPHDEGKGEGDSAEGATEGDENKEG